MESLRIRFPLMAVVLLAALAAMWAGLVRLGWGLPPLTPTLTMAHGPLMISGFLGTLINLERVVALNRRWAFAAPLVTASGVVVLLLGVTGPIGPLLMLLGSLGMVAIFVLIVRRQPALYTITMAMGALAWLVGNGLWLAGWPIYRIVFWWMGFLVLTIAGERLEMSRVLRIPRSSQMLFLGLTGIFGVGLVLVSLDLDLGWRVAGLGMLGLSAWLLRYDVARRTVRQTGLTRFIAVSLLSGFVWLGVSGALAIVFGKVMAGPRYDAVLHAVFLGFVFSMIFGHAPIILPAMLGLPMAFQPVFYSHWALLHLSLLLRVIGDVAGWFPMRQWGGMFNVIALLLFLYNTARAVIRSRSERRAVAGDVTKVADRLFPRSENRLAPLPLPHLAAAATMSDSGSKPLRPQSQKEDTMNHDKTIAFLLGTLLGVLVGVIVVSGVFIAVVGPHLTTQVATAPQPAPGVAAQVKPTAYPAAAPVSDQAVSGGALEGKVQIANQTFSPHTLIVATGAQITWKNEDTMNHTITSAEGWFDSKEILPGGTFTWKADKPGALKYHCDIHKSMEGVIIVQPGGAVASTLFGGKLINQFFTDTCGGCHGPHREGGTGPALIPARLASDDDFYFKTIKSGRPGTIMPAWGASGVTDDEVWSLVGFIRSEPKAEEVKWELPQIAASRAVLVDEKTLPAKPTHSGNLDNLLLVTEREARKIAVIDGDTNKLLGHIEASYRAHGYTFDPTNDRWAYNVGRDGWLFKIDLYTLQAVTKVRVGHDSRGIAISDDGKWIITGNFVPNTAVILKADTLEPVKVIVTEGNDPQGKFVKSRVCIVSDVSPKLVGPYFIIALKEAGQMWRIDWSKPDFPIDKVEGVGNILHDGFLSPDNKLFYIASQKDNWMGVIDVVNWKLVDKISTGAAPHPGSGAAWTAADGHVYGATVHAGEGKITIWDLKDDKIVGAIKTDGPGLFIRSSDHSPYVWADALFGQPANKIYVFDKNPPFKLVKVIEEGVQTLHPEFTADGKFAYVADWQDNKVRVYNATTFEKVAEIDGIAAPTGIFSVERRQEPLGH